MLPLLRISDKVETNLALTYLIYGPVEEILRSVDWVGAMQKPSFLKVARGRRFSASSPVEIESYRQIDQ